MSKLKKLVLSSMLFFSLGAVAQTPQELFNEGTKAYLTKDYSKAQEFFSQALDLDPHNSTTITNLALAEYQLGKKFLSVGLLRKALHYDPNLSAAREALDFTLPQLPKGDVPRKLESYETLRGSLLQPIPFMGYLLLSSMSLFAAGWTWLAFAGRRKRALEQEQSLPGFPLIPSLLAVLFVIFSSLAGLKFYDSSILRATIVDEKVSVQTAPGDNQVSILELGGGLEVVIRDSQGDWVQITYPGSVTGWIKKSSVLMTR